MLGGRPWCRWARFQQNLAQTCPVVRLSWEGGVARGVLTVECIVASEVDQCQLCPVDMEEGADNEA